MKTNRQFDDMVARNSSLEERNIHLHELLEDANHKLEVLGSFSVFTSQPDRLEKIMFALCLAVKGNVDCMLTVRDCEFLSKVLRDVVGNKL